MHIVLQFPGKNTHLSNGKGTDNSMENLSDITDDHQNYEECDRCIKKEPESEK